MKIILKLTKMTAG